MRNYTLTVVSGSCEIHLFHWLVRVQRSSRRLSPAVFHFSPSSRSVFNGMLYCNWPLRLSVERALPWDWVSAGAASLLAVPVSL